ncbi:MAG: hypothetical protein GY839_22070, partial [candidate division Zixibacteria bacterium]|nr:hypothetical protein [candidate division Zixibacteria bacterium]
ITTTSGSIGIEATTGSIIQGGIINSSSTLNYNSAGAITIDAAITAAGDLAIKTTDGSINQAGTINTSGNLEYDSSSTITINETVTTGGTVDINSAGVTTVTASGDITAEGEVVFGSDKQGSLSIAGDITTSSDNIEFNRKVTLTGDITLDTGAGAGNMNFESEIKGDHKLTMSAGSGNIDFEKNVGRSGAYLSGISVTSAAQLKFHKKVKVNSEGIDITAGDVTFNNKVKTRSGGSVEINNSGLLTLARKAKMTIGGSFEQTGTGNVSNNTSIKATSGDVSFASDKVETKGMTISTPNQTQVPQFDPSMRYRYFKVIWWRR